MRAPAPLALGCISLVLCLLELPGCQPLPAGRSPKRREPPDRSPPAAPHQRPPAALLLGARAAPRPAGGPRRPQLAPRLPPQHRPRLVPRLVPRHGPRLGPRLDPRLVPWHVPRLVPRIIPRLAPRHSPRLAPRPGAQPPRRRRHLRGRLQQGQLLRVGCALGTCQVQNLGHRLWQLVGRAGRQDSSPMNPNSPHSYG
ncbi:protein ADM2 [Rhea pennata]|uniref:protein ADM2 n=1 Tax=Rhea pennata TaxID=8795 RepID=UPI002E25DDFE